MCHYQCQQQSGNNNILLALVVQNLGRIKFMAKFRKRVFRILDQKPVKSRHIQCLTDMKLGIIIVIIVIMWLAINARYVIQGVKNPKCVCASL